MNSDFGGNRQMSNIDKQALTDEAISKAFTGTNFGRDDFKNILAETVIDAAAGWRCGYTATTICTQLGLLTPKGCASALGLRFISEHVQRETKRLKDELEAAEKRIAELEVREVKPVAWRCDSGSIANRRVVTVSEFVADSWAEKGMDVSPLYTAPPATVSIPDEWRQWISDAVDYLEGGLEADGELEAEGSIEAKRLLSRRAAMLQGADGTITNEGTIQDGNSPVIHDGGNTTPPYQGWVVTHGGKDYFYRKQSDAVTRLNAAIESGGGASLIAVIAEPVTTADKLPEGWVACSERMPEQFVEVLVCTEDGGRYVAALNQSMTWDDGDFFDDIQYVTHWMPLPAAPQQETK